MSWVKVSTYGLAVLVGVIAGAFAVPFSNDISGNQESVLYSQPQPEKKGNNHADICEQDSRIINEFDHPEGLQILPPEELSLPELAKQYKYLLEENDKLREKLKNIAQEDTKLRLIDNFRKSNKWLKTQVNEQEEQLKSALIEASLLANKLQEYDPEAVKDIATNSEEVKTLLPASVAKRVARLSDRSLQRVVDFHKKEDALEGDSYLFQQYLNDFIISHPNGHLVKISSLSCKNSMCELYLQETVTQQTLLASGMDKAEIKTYLNDQAPAYRAIKVDLINMPSIDVRGMSSSGGRFDSYMLFKVRWR